MLLSFPVETAERLSRVPISALDWVLRAPDPDADFDPTAATFYPAIEVELRKKGASKELVLDKLYITVTGYDEAPTDFYQSVHPTSFTPEIVLCAKLSKPPHLPNTFPIDTVIADGKAEELSMGEISFKDEFATRIKIIVQAKDPGIYRLSITAEFTGDRVKGYKCTLTDEEISFLYLPARLIPASPPPGEELVYVGNGKTWRDPTAKAKTPKESRSAAKLPDSVDLEPVAKSKVVTPIPHPGQVPTPGGK